jgi:hypothetical protein
MLQRWVGALPIVLGLALLTTGGLFLLDRADRQARDTIRKHDIEDIEHGLYFARSANGTFPPYDKASWCGVLSHPENSAVRDEIEKALRERHPQYANAEKPFPQDPVHGGGTQDYFYWKRSPSSFELYAVLETDRTGERSSDGCDAAPGLVYDYGIASHLREDGGIFTNTLLPL